MSRTMFARKLAACVALAAMTGYILAPIAAQASASGKKPALPTANALAAAANEHDVIRPAPRGKNDSATTTPIKHLIVIIGENRSFDHVFATYQPKTGNTIWNLLSEGIVNADGTPGANYTGATQASAVDQTPNSYSLSPPGVANYTTLPAPLVGGPTKPLFTTDAAAEAAEYGIEPADAHLLTTGGTGQTAGTPDKRIQYDGHSVNDLPPGPFQLTSKTMPYDAYTASPVHRFYQMWQQLHCNVEKASGKNASGCLANLFAWVEVTVGAGTNGVTQPSGFNDETTGEGSTSMGFYNMSTGDVPYFKMLADNYATSDNMHQSVDGGTGANHIMFGHGDAIWFADANGRPAEPPENIKVGTGSKNAGVVAEVENPNPAKGTNNWYVEDGYGAGSYGSPSSGGGSYTNCSDIEQPGVLPVLVYLAALPYIVDPRCAPNHYYLLNNYNPGYFGNGSNAYTNNNNDNTVFTIPPSPARDIGNELDEHSVSWVYYGDHWNRYLKDQYDLNYPIDGYCNICNPFQYDTSIMANKTERETHLQDTMDLYDSIGKGHLPAVAIVKPSGLVDGHPASSKLDLFEAFVKKIVDGVQAQPALWASTAIVITFDEGGGYWDSGYVQPLDYFGDGTRIPLQVVSPFTTAGHISHTYIDHVSILKFIEANWTLDPVTPTSRDNFPNPIAKTNNPYVPLNSPAIGDLTDLFTFP
jgi:phospholipase C